jgi:hypothetical protein
MFVTLGTYDLVEKPLMFNYNNLDWSRPRNEHRVGR